MRVNLGISAGRKSFNVIWHIFFFNTVSFQNVDSFIISNGSFQLCGIVPDDIISIDMNADSIVILSVFLFAGDAVIDVQNFQIFTAEVCRISVEKAEILSFLCVGLDAVAGDNADLKPVIGHKIVLSPAHDLVG